jgi:hypothetical protein
MGKLGTGEIVLGLAVSAAAIWCFNWGPCKGWMNQLTSKINNGDGGNNYGLDNNTVGKIKSAVSSPEAQRILNDYSSGRISEAQMRQQATALGRSYASRYTIANM